MGGLCEPRVRRVAVQLERGHQRLVSGLPVIAPLGRRGLLRVHLGEVVVVETGPGGERVDHPGKPGAVVDALRHLILPAIVLGTVPLGVIARMTRSSMLEVLSEDYVRTARAKGLSPLRVIGLHALRNALLPVVTVIGLSISGLMAGAVLTETIFSWPGVGKWLIESIGRRDYPALQGGVLLVSAAVITVNLIVDLLYGAINPRIRHGR